MEMMALPETWAVSSVGDVSEYIQRGKSPKYADLSRLPVVNQRSIRWHGIQDEHLKYVHEDQFSAWDEARFIQEGDILWNSTGTGTIGRACLVRQEHTDPPKVVDSHVTIVRSNKRIVEPGYLFAWIRGPEVQQKIEDLATGTTNQIELNRSTIASTLIPIAPVNEQRRIAAKLDSTLAAVEACRKRLDGVAVILKRFRQAVLAAATSGELTREWREERGLGHEPFKRLNLKDLVQEPLRNGKSVRDGEGDYVLRLSCLKSDSVDWSESKRGDWDGIDVDRFLICQGDFLVARGNGSKVLVGRGCLVNEPPPRMAFPDTMIRIRPNQEKIHPVYLSIAWEHRSTRDQIEGSARTSAGIWKVAQSDLEVIRLPIPDQYEEQVEVVRRSHELFSLADQLEARLTSARKIVDRLTPALLAKAFRGELVPQDPSDEPASVLLERIRAARQAEAAAGKPSRRGRRKAATNPDQIAMEAAPVSADFLAGLLRECGALSERALLAVSELEPQRFQQQLYRELESGTAREVQENGQVLLEAVG